MRDCLVLCCPHFHPLLFIQNMAALDIDSGDLFRGRENIVPCNWKEGRWWRGISSSYLILIRVWHDCANRSFNSVVFNIKTSVMARTFALLVSSCFINLLLSYHLFLSLWFCCCFHLKRYFRLNAFLL
jgi:hypothetical protein